MPEQTRLYSANGDWVRALERTAAITPDTNRTLAAVVAERAASTDAIQNALIGEHQTLTYGGLAGRAAQFARWGRRMGLQKGDCVALMLGNTPDYPAIWLGLSQIGVVSALLNTQLVGPGLAHCLALSDARHIIVDRDHVEAVAALQGGTEIWTHGVTHAAGRSLDDQLGSLSGSPLEIHESADIVLRDPALLIYTSGTTGLPKAARVSHFRIMMWSEWFAGIANAGRDDRLYNCLPMYHSVGGVVAIGAMLAAGGGVIVRDGFSARRFWPDVVESGATIFQYIGELCRYLLNTPTETAPRHTLRLCVGNGLRADVWEAFADRFAIPRIIEFYAATEGSFSLFNLEGQPGAIGRIPRFMAHQSPVALVRFDHDAEQPVRDDAGLCQRCAVGEAGEAIGRIAEGATSLATRFEGYTIETETNRKVLRDVFSPGDMWFRTGDLMRQDKAGFFYFVDRIGDTFRWKGENVATVDVADAVAACPGVIDVAVYGVVVPFADGRAGMATLVIGPDFDLGVLHKHLADRLPRYARPVFVRLADSMDLTGTFKLKKQTLVAQGFDPDAVDGRLFVDDGHIGAYTALDVQTYSAIIEGRLRL